MLLLTVEDVVCTYQFPMTAEICGACFTHLHLLIGRFITIVGAHNLFKYGRVHGRSEQCSLTTRIATTVVLLASSGLIVTTTLVINR